MKSKTLIITALVFIGNAVPALGLKTNKAQEHGGQPYIDREINNIKDIADRVKKQKRPIKIAVIDTGLDRQDPRFSKVLCKYGHRNFVDGTTNTYDYHGHGTHVAGLIKEQAGDSGYCLVILKYYETGSKGNESLRREIEAIRWAVQIGVDIVNFSGGGSMFESAEYEAISKGKNTLFIVAAGNESEDIMDSKNRYYPASYNLPNIVLVGNLTRDNTRAPSSNYGDPRMVWEVGTDLVSSLPCNFNNSRDTFRCQGQMTGTSQATGVHTGKVVRTILER